MEKETGDKMNKMTGKKRNIVIGLIGAIILVTASSIFYATQIEPRYEEKKIVPEKYVCPTINDFKQYVNYMNSGTWSSGCLPPSYAIIDYAPVSSNQIIQHVITAKVIQFEDSPQRIITTLSNEKYVVDNYTKSMKIGDMIHIFEVKNTVYKCLPSVVDLYNFSQIRGIDNVSKFINSTHWLDFTTGANNLFFPPYNDTKCNQFTSYFEVNAN